MRNAYDTREKRYEQLVREHAVLLRRFAVTQVGNGAADDVVAETLEAAWFKVEQNDEPTSWKPWLVAVLLNRCKMLRRSEVRRAGRQHGNPSDQLSDDGGIDSAIERIADAPQAEALRTAFLSLNPEEQLVLALVAWQGLEPSEVAATLEINPATVRSHLHRARTRCASALGAQHEQHEEAIGVRDE